MFIRHKKDDTCRFMLRLKNSYEHVQYDYKKDTLKSGKQLMKTNCYRALVDLRDAYYSEPIDEEY